VVEERQQGIIGSDLLGWQDFGGWWGGAIHLGKTVTASAIDYVST